MSNELRRWIRLVEGRDAPLYHGCAPDVALRILAKDELRGTTLQIIDDQRVKGVSLTRNAQFAPVWGWVVFVLDQRRLAMQHAMKPINFYNRLQVDAATGRGEAEEFVVGSITGLQRFLTAIHIAADHAAELRSDGGYEPLLSHPKLKIITRP